MALVSVLLIGPAGAERKPPDFDREIRPIFERHCYECHGPTAAEGGLRLTSRETAFTPGDYGIEVITPGSAELSLLHDRLIESDPEERMPHKREALSPDEIELVRRWIEAGADWPDVRAPHWAYVAPSRPEVPGPGHPVDAFVRRKLAAEGVEPSPPAEPARLLRRLHLDLLGLPPTPADVRAFVADPSAEHYERIVDELLASPRFGERWATPWLDAARYSDSNGFQKDNFRHTWGYRDWVIDAINADMPFDRFTIEQLAGDLLPDAEDHQIVATGFHRAATVNVEVGVDPEEDRIRQVMDRVNTTAVVWLGSSLECAQCHDHKFDAFTQREYYELFAFFNNSPPDVKQIGKKGVAYQLAGPRIDLPNPPERQARLDEVHAQIAAERRRFAAIDRKATFALWRDDRKTLLDAPIEWTNVDILEVESSGDESHTVEDDGSVAFHGSIPDTVEHRVRFTAPLDRITAIRVERLGALPGPDGGKRPRRGLPMLSEVHLERTTTDGRGQREHVPIWITQPPDDPKLAYLWLTIDDDDESPWPMAGPPVYLFEAIPGDSTLRLTLSQSYGFGRTLDRFRVAVTDAPREILVLPARIRELLRARESSDEDEAEIFAYFSKHGFEAASTLPLLRQRAVSLRPATSLVMAELPEPRTSNVLIRGSHLSPGDPVKPGTPTVLPPMTSDLPRNRLGLARWLVDPANPLVARVTVNRLWASLFGAGLVRTPEEFGTRGERPTHPDLLDWLATEFIERGWSRKKMVRLLVTSETYKQTSAATPERLRDDPENRLLARQSRRRLDAEFIRDNALAVSGLLENGGQGRPTYPPQPPGLWKHVGSIVEDYQTSWGPDRFRRGIYTIHRRSAPYPSFVNFDAPDRSTCTVKRARTTTPLQALTLLNDEAYVEMTLALAVRILVEGEYLDERDRIDHAMRLVVARPARSAELDLLGALLASERARFDDDPGAASALLASSEGYQPPADLDPTDVAAWDAVASALLNLDETITRS